eukprot:Em0001g1544a
MGAAPAKELLEAIKQTPEFQRLHEISQLGGVAYVFEKADHKRYDHSEGLGTYNTAEVNLLQYISHTTAGHGPYSHLYFNRIKEALIERGGLRAESSIKLESQVHTSCMILEKILERPEVKDKFEMAGLGETDIEFIKALIKGKPKRGLRPSEKDFLYEIVNNKYNYIDVKLWDYLERDTAALKEDAKTKDDQKPIYSELLNTAIVMDVGNGTAKRSHIVYHHKAMADIYRLFHTKEMLHRRVYQHTDANAVEMMISDGLLVTNLIKTSFADISSFLNLQDAKVLKDACKELECIELHSLHRL